MTPEEIVKRLDRKWRTSDLTLQQIGDRAGMPLQQVYATLSGLTRNPGIRTVWRIAEAMDMEVTIGDKPY